MKRIVSAIALSGTIAMMGAAGATAAEYPAPPPSVTVSVATIAPGESLVFSGTGFTPGETINITATNEGSPQASSGGGFSGGRAGAAVGQKITLPSVVTEMVTVAKADGSFSATITLNEPGTYTLTAKGATSGQVRTSIVTVTEVAVNPAAANVAGTNLANTGFPLALWSAIGLTALAGGAASVIVVRRKASSEVA